MRFFCLFLALLALPAAAAADKPTVAVLYFGYGGKTPLAVLLGLGGAVLLGAAHGGLRPPAIRPGVARIVRLLGGHAQGRIDVAQVEEDIRVLRGQLRGPLQVRPGLLHARAAERSTPPDRPSRPF